MEINLFKEMINVTTKGHWFSIDDFEALVKFIFGEHGFDKKYLDTTGIVMIVSTMIDVGFVEFDKVSSMIRVKREWYDEENPSV